MNNEPVAWMDEYERICHATDKRMEEITNNIGSPRNYFNYTIPLYTTPQTKELSDEEIKEFIEDIIDAMGLSMEFTAVRKSGWDIGIKKFRELSKSE